MGQIRPGQSNATTVSWSAWSGSFEFIERIAPSCQHLQYPGCLSLADAQASGSAGYYSLLMQRHGFNGTFMSRKDDLDNHANQLNPNNDTYYSSRNGSSGGNDDDYDTVAVIQRHWREPAPRPFHTVREEVEFTVVTMNGQSCLAKVLICDTSSWNDRLQKKLEDKALELHQQLCDGVKRLSGSPIVYAQLNIGRSTVDALKPWEPTVPAGWSRPWERIDRKQWQRLARTRSYRQQAIEARLGLDQAAAQVGQELGRLVDVATGSRVKALADVAMVFRKFSKAPIFQVNAYWAAALERARKLDVLDDVQAVMDGIDGLARTLRTVDVLVRASNARAPESSRHPASYGMYLPPSDAYGDYFGGTACSARMDELDVWFNKGERRLRAVLAVLKSGKLKARYDFGTYDMTMNPDFHISKVAVERAMKPANRRAAEAC